MDGAKKVLACRHVHDLETESEGMYVCSLTKSVWLSRVVLIPDRAHRLAALASEGCSGHWIVLACLRLGNSDR
jgi:hypothetical protein